MLSVGACLPSETPPVRAVVNDPNGGIYSHVSGRTERAVYEATIDVVDYRRALREGRLHA